MRKFLSNFCYCKSGFSLMELMIVLLVVSIIAAATAPMIAKKSARSAGGSGSAVGYLGIGNNFGNQVDDSSLILGRNNLPQGSDNAKLFLENKGNDDAHIAFGVNGAVTGILKILGNSGISLGNSANGSGQNSIAIGNNATATQTNSVAIGNGATASGTDSVAIGHNASTGNNAHCVVISTGNSIGNVNLGANTIVLGGESDTVVIPGKLKANNIDFSGLSGNEHGTVVLGNENTTFYMPGNLVINGSTVLGWQGGESNKGKTGAGIYFRESGVQDDNHGDMVKFGYGGADKVMRVDNYNKEVSVGEFPVWHETCDRRLKNVGEKFTGGLEEIKKLDLYNFTFKSDKAKTPQVGVMAQDLQKIFPNSVREGADKYLRIRWDEMFYAVINAVKELDAKITAAVEEIKANTDKTEELQAQLDEEREINKSQQKVIENLEKRIAKLEKKREFKQKQE